jgi:hypothetical protein
MIRVCSYAWSYCMRCARWAWLMLHTTWPWTVQLPAVGQHADCSTFTARSLASAKHCLPVVTLELAKPRVCLLVPLGHPPCAIILG